MVGEHDTVDDWVEKYREQIEQSRAVAASMDLDSTCARTDLIDCNLRYVLFHMIEETARHAGHADIIRETLDGSRGIWATRRVERRLTGYPGRGWFRLGGEPGWDGSALPNRKQRHGQMSVRRHGGRSVARLSC